MDKSTVVAVFTDSILEDAPCLINRIEHKYKFHPLEGFIRSNKIPATVSTPGFARRCWTKESCLHPTSLLLVVLGEIRTPDRTKEGGYCWVFNWVAEIKMRELVVVVFVLFWMITASITGHYHGIQWRNLLAT